jgi:aspartokinase
MPLRYFAVMGAITHFLNLQQVWKDVDGVLTCDPNIYANAVPVPFLTFDEAAELAYFGGQVFFVGYLPVF